LPVLEPKARKTGPSAAELSLFQLLEPDILANPYPLFQRLRENDPVHWDPYMHTWVVTSYPEVVQVLTKYQADRMPSIEELEKLGMSDMAPFSAMMLKQMLFRDGEAHSRIRTLCAVAFTPRRMEALRASIETIANELIDAVIETGRMDIINDFAAPFPGIVMTRLIGVPDEDHVKLKDWSNDFAELLGNFQHNPDRVPQVLNSLGKLTEYFRHHMEIQRQNPNDGVLATMMAAQEVDGTRLTDEEIIANSIMILVGGHETSTNLIGNGILTLLRRPEKLAQLRDDPSIIVPATEELLRFESPSQHSARLAPEDIVLGGKSIRKGSIIMAIMAAANRDPQRFPNPDELDLQRQDNRHVAFGWGAHFCLGAQLSRIEGQVAFNVLLRRLVDIQLADQKLEWRGNVGLRGLKALHVRFAAATA